MWLKKPSATRLDRLADATVTGEGPDCRAGLCHLWRQLCGVIFEKRRKYIAACGSGHTKPQWSQPIVRRNSRFLLLARCIHRATNRDLTAAHRYTDPGVDTTVRANNNPHATVPPHWHRSADGNPRGTATQRQHRREQADTRAQEATLGDKRSDAGTALGSSNSIAIWVQTVRHKVTAFSLCTR